MPTVTDEEVSGGTTKYRKGPSQVISYRPRRRGTANQLIVNNAETCPMSPYAAVVAFNHVFSAPAIANPAQEHYPF